MTRDRHGRDRRPVLGIDVGGVLVDRASEGSDTSFFGRNPMRTPAVEHSLEAVRTMAELFEHRIHVVSKAGPKVAALTRHWLSEQGFFDPGGITPQNVTFVHSRADKHPICVRLGITHFVDDRLDVLQRLISVDHLYLLTAGLGHNSPPERPPRTITVVNSWTRLVGLLQRDIDCR